MGLKIDIEGKNMELTGLTKLVMTIATMCSHDVDSKKQLCEANSSRTSKLIEVQTNEDIRKIVSGELHYDNEKGLVNTNIDECEFDVGRIMPTFNIAEYPNTLSGVDDRRKDRNTLNTVNLAAEILSASTITPSEEPVQEDWFFSWREAASSFSSDYMSKLWAEILAGEVLTPKKFSLRTLEYLKTLSQEEAETINELSAFVINGRVFIDAKAILEANNLAFHQCLELQDLGILQGVNSTALAAIFSPLAMGENLNITFVPAHSHMFKLSSEVKKDFRPRCYVLTKVGREIITLSHLPLNEEYLEEVKRIGEKAGFKVEIIPVASK